MIVTGHINYFNVAECGLYKHNDFNPHGCELSETFDLIKSWVGARSFVDTIPWSPGESRSNSPKCYCRDIYKCEATGEFLLVLWKSDTDGAGTLLGAKEDDAPGQGEVVAYTNNYKGSKVVWGRPCYYWIIPDKNLILSIKFDHSVCDSVMMQDWVVRCINNRVDHPGKAKETTEKGFVRISFQEQGKSSPTRFSYRFDAKLCSLNTSSAEMTDLAAKVTYIIRRETVLLKTAPDDRAAWVRLFDSVPYLNTKPKAKVRQVEVRAEAKPTASELKGIIETFARENRAYGEWDNVGFETDAGNTVWVDKYRLRSSININQEDGKIFSAASLHARLAAKRTELLSEVTKGGTTAPDVVAKVAGA